MVMVNNGAGRKYTFDIAKTPRAPVVCGGPVCEITD